MFSRLSNSMTFLRGLLLLLLAAPAWGQVNVLTQHNDNARTGANLNETQLTTANVNYNQFGKLFTCPVDGQIYAQPLYVSQLALPGQGTHNVVFVATMNNSVYAFDADAAGTPLWKANFGPSIPAGELEQTPDIVGTVGILGTPVIDPATNTMYFVARTKAGQTGVVTSYVQQLHAIDITTGQDRSGSPVVVQATVAGTGDGAVGGSVAFNPMRENQRPALLLQNGVIYICWGSHTDTTPAHGWLMGYNAWGVAAPALQQTAIYNTCPNGSLDSIWQAGQGPTVDGAGNIYVETGNGTSDAMSGGSGYGECFLKLTPGAGTLSVTDWFMPSNAATLNAHDLDLGCGGILGLPGTNLLLGGSKQGILYLLDSTNMTNMVHFNASADNIVQEFQACNGHVHGSPIYWNSPATGPTVYVWSEQDYLKAYKFNYNSASPDQSYLTSTPAFESTMPVPPGMPGGFLSLSASGSTAGTGIIWASHPYNASANQATVSGILRAFDATNLTHELWDSKQLASRDDVGNFAKFCPPTVANGKVYLATFSNKLLVYGLLPVPTGPPAAPANVVATAGSAQIALSWPAVPTASSYNLYRSLPPGGEGATPYLTGVTTPCTDAPLTNGTQYFYTVTAVNVKGESGPSQEVSATPTAVAGVQINCGGGAAAPFAADAGFTGGSAASVAAAIDTGGVASPAPQAVYQSQRYGSFTYALTGLTPGAAYTVRLHFAETFWAAPGKRLFAVAINGQTALNNFDVFAAAGGANKAVAQQFAATADGGGRISLAFTTQLDNAMVSGIEALLNAPVTPPAAPTGVQAAAGNAQVSLTWNAVPGAASYNIYSSVTSGGENATPPVTGITAPAFTATGLANGTPEFYVVTAVNTAGESGPSQEVSATPVDSALTVVNPAAASPSPATGKTVGLSVLGSDSQGEGSITYTWSTTGAVPAPVTYSANGSNAAKNTTATFTKAGTYNFLVTLADGLGASKTSSVSVSVVPALTGIVVSPATANVPTRGTQTFTASGKDQFGAALAPQPAFTWATTGGGTISAGGLYSAGTTVGGPYAVTATSGSLSGQASVKVVTPPAAPTQINCGGGAAAPFAADAGFTGGSAYAVAAAIDTGGVASPAPQAVYQSQRYGSFTYALTGLTPGAAYTVRLHFAETFWAAPGKRLFAVAINGQTALNNFDVFAAAGARNRAVARQFPATADPSGAVTLLFKTQADTAMVSGIEVQPFAAPTTVPAAPATLSATAGVGQITLAWPASATATSYNLYRSLTPGGEGAAPYKPGLTGLSFADTGVTSGTPYFYTVTAVNQAGEGAPSTEAGATPLAPPPAPTQINCGGGAAAPFAADAGFTGGSAYAVAAAIDTGGVASPAPQAVYQSQRYGSFTYALTGLTPGAAYTVRLHFAETFWAAPGKRLFAVAINGQTALNNFDVFAAAGGANKAVAQQFAATADGGGRISLAFTTQLDNAMVSGIEIH